jgi:hypothetical protein
MRRVVLASCAVVGARFGASQPRQRRKALLAEKSERPVGGPAARALGMEGTVVEAGWASPDHSGDSALHYLAGR